LKPTVETNIRNQFSTADVYFYVAIILKDSMACPCWVQSEGGVSVIELQLLCPRPYNQPFCLLMYFGLSVEVSTTQLLH
jgi:hypothetical protein